jgi:hypothetical protein
VDNDISNIQFADEDDPSSIHPNRGDASSLQLSMDIKDHSGTGAGRGSSIDGLDMDLSEDVDTPKKKRVAPTGPRRMRKRRKVTVDNDKTELTSEFIKNMLLHTSDVVLKNRPLPTDWTEGEISRPVMSVEANIILSTLPNERLFARPCLGDDGALAPELLQLWDDNAARMQGRSVPFRMRGRAGEEQRAQRAERAMQDAAEAEEVEEGRFASERESGEGVTSVGGLPSVGQSHGDGDTMFPQDEYEEDQAHFNIDDETGPAQNTADMVGINDIDDMGRISKCRYVFVRQPML